MWIFTIYRTQTQKYNNELKTLKENITRLQDDTVTMKQNLSDGYQNLDNQHQKFIRISTRKKEYVKTLQSKNQQLKKELKNCETTLNNTTCKLNECQTTANQPKLSIFIVIIEKIC